MLHAIGVGFGLIFGAGLGVLALLIVIRILGGLFEGTGI